MSISAKAVLPVILGIAVGVYAAGSVPADIVLPHWGTFPRSEAASVQQVATPGVPVRIAIPVLGVDAKVEPVGKAPDGRMDVPKNNGNAGWYELGVKPGERGSAVIDGHVNTPTLARNIFADLGTLVPGSRILITDDGGRTWSFRVDRVESVPSEGFPIAEVFGRDDANRLNLITCDGVYERSNADYTRRTVVYSTLDKTDDGPSRIPSVAP
jgi:sortase A